MYPKKVNKDSYDHCCSLQTCSALNLNVLCTCWNLLHEPSYCSAINAKTDKSMGNNQRQVVVLMNFPDGNVRPFP
jgi:hypothetical protein